MQSTNRYIIWLTTILGEIVAVPNFNLEAQGSQIMKLDELKIAANAMITSKLHSLGKSTLPFRFTNRQRRRAFSTVPLLTRSMLTSRFTSAKT